MTCAAPKDKGRMRSPDGEAAEWVNRKGGCLKKVGGFGYGCGGNGQRGNILGPLSACEGESHHPPNSPALGH